MPDANDNSRGSSRQVATDRDYTLSVEDVAEHHAADSHPRTTRTLQF